MNGGVVMKLFDDNVIELYMQAYATTPLLVLDNKGVIQTYNESFREKFKIMEKLIGKSIDTIFSIVEEQYNTNTNDEYKEIQVKKFSCHWCTSSILDLHLKGLKFSKEDGCVLIFQETQLSDMDIVSKISALNVEMSDLTRELSKKKKDLERANAAKSQFLANMSHEIRTPMNGILGFLQILEHTNLDKQQMSYIENIKSSTDILLTVINDILDVSKIEAGKLELEKVVFNLRNTVESSITPFIVKALEKSVDINVLVRPKVPEFVVGDSTRLKQVIANLVSNAVKFTEEGIVFLEVKLLKEDSHLHTLSISVEDTGIGMSKETVNRLFDAFTQADASSTRKFGGTGLGLCISKSIVEMMDGQITLESEEGKGTKFIVTLCLQKADNQEMGSQEHYNLLKGKRIMIVDDNKMNRQIARIYLEEVGCMVLEASSAADSISKMVKEEGLIYNAVLIDFSMPNMDGYDLAAALKVIQSTKHIPLILLSSMGIVGGHDQAKINGFCGYLSKPYRRKELLDTVLAAIEGKKYNNLEERTAVMKTIPYNRKRSKEVKILLVEDNDINRKFFVKMLEMIELTCDVCTNGAEAVRAFKENTYDIIFMDCQMPLIDGYEATKQIRLLEEGDKRTTVIALTAYAMKEDAKKCMDAGMDDYLSKPVNFNQVTEMIQKYSMVKDQSNCEMFIKRLIDEVGFEKQVAQELIVESMPEILKLYKSMACFMKNNQINKVTEKLHQLRGACGNLRMREFENIVINAEGAVEKEDIDEINHYIKELGAVLRTYDLPI